MPAIWSSSERPISVRTVWVDGVRHAILTSDDPAALMNSRIRRRSQTSSRNSQKAYPLNYHRRRDSFDDSSAESLGSCFVKLHVVVDKRECENDTSARIIHRQSAPPQCNRGIAQNSRNLLELRLSGVLNFTTDSAESHDSTGGVSNRSTRRSSRDSSNTTKKNFIPTFNNLTKETIDSCTDCTNSSPYVTELEEGLRKTPEILSNRLSERVLQWMDLSGRVMDYRCEEDKERALKERISNSARYKSSCFKKEFSTKEQVVVQNYKMQTDRKLLDSEAREIRVSKVIRRRISKERDDFAKISMPNAKINQLQSSVRRDVEPNETSQNSRGEFRCETETQKSLWSSLGRPQLHIFMPDLNSSGEDTSSEVSMTKD